MGNFHELFLWAIFIKKLGHNPDTSQLSLNYQHEEKKMLKWFCQNFVRYIHGLFMRDIVMSFWWEIFHEKYSWAIFEIFFMKKVSWDNFIKKFGHNPDFSQLYCSSQHEKGQNAVAFLDARASLVLVVSVGSKFFMRYLINQ